MKNRTQILVIGQGAAGLRAACAAAETGAEVLVVGKGSCASPEIMGFNCVTEPGDSFQCFYEDIMQAGQEINHTALARQLAEGSIHETEFLTSLGVTLDRKVDGSYHTLSTLGCRYPRLVHHQALTGVEEMRRMEQYARELHVEFMPRVTVTDLVVCDGRVCGALGFDTINGDFYRFDARVVIAASGMGGWKTSYGKNTPTGETMQMTYEAGAVLQNLEFARVWNMPRLFGWEGQTVLMPLGARFVNAEGEPFMERYSPVLGSNTDPHYTTMAMAMEIRAGRGPITFDLSRIQQENLILLRPQNGWQKLNYDKLSALGLDLFRDSTEWVPQMTVSYGGLRADAWGNTNLEGLLAAGTARATEPGVYAGGFALMTTSVLGHMAGENAARLLQTLPEVKSDLSDAEITARQQSLFAPLGKEGLTPKEVLTSIQKTVFPYGVSTLKNERSLQAALKELERIREEDLPRMVATDPHYLLKLHETRGVAFVSEMYVRASLERKETRAGHYREDYPVRDESQLAWLCLRKDADSKPEFFRAPVPLEKYKHPVTRYYQDNFAFPTSESAK